MVVFRDYQSWIRAFEPLYTRSMVRGENGKRNPDCIAASMVLTRGMTSILVIQGVVPVLSHSIIGMFRFPLFKCLPLHSLIQPGPSNHKVNDLKRNCREALCLLQTIGADPSFRREFVFDCAVIPSLFMVMISPVDDMRINREALWLMRSFMPRREGALDSTALVKVGESFLGSGME